MSGTGKCGNVLRSQNEWRQCFFYIFGWMSIEYFKTFTWMTKLSYIPYMIQTITNSWQIRACFQHKRIGRCASCWFSYSCQGTTWSSTRRGFLKYRRWSVVCTCHEGYIMKQVSGTKEIWASGCKQSLENFTNCKRPGTVSSFTQGFCQHSVLNKPLRTDK